MNLPIPTHHPITEEPSSVTLLARHLPEAIPPDTVSRLFSHYGASSVRPCSHGRMKNCAFLDFNNEVLASKAQRQLHGLRFLGKVLSVERANKVTEDRKRLHGEAKTGKDSSSLMNNNASSAEKLADKARGGEPIAEKLGVNYPFPPHLEYAYPPPDGHILTNIVNSLIAVPRFYTQVLHLMNKMNIPAPFRKALPTPPLPLSAPIPLYQPPQPPPPPPLSSENKMEDLSSSESEMESSDEEIRGEDGPKRKRVKRKAIVGPAVDKNVPHEAVGLKPVSLFPKERPIIKKNNSILQIKIAPKQVHPEQKDHEAVTNVQESNVENPDHRSYATIEELNSGRLPPEEILSRPMFKNYAVGEPNANLYIKNLAKDVVVQDFYYIFGSFFGSVEAAKSILSIKLMQEGRMRGQAFVTFPTVELAHNALSTVNGYVFKGKPMVIQFSRPKNQN